MSSKLLVETRDQVRWLTINRAERRNALDRETMTLLREAVVGGGQDPEVRVLVIGGAGGAFSAGADLKANAEVNGRGDLIDTCYNPAIRAIRHAKKAVIAEVLENERYHQQDIFRTADFKEGVAAFLEKRAATYEGR